MSIEDRGRKYVLFEFKKELGKWRHGKFEIWVDTLILNLYIQNEWVMSITNQGSEVKTEFGEE